MIKSTILHPHLLSMLAKCGHKTKILIADSNYSFVTNSSPGATIVYLNVAPGMIASPFILEKLLSYINVEEAALMSSPEDFNNTIEQEYQRILPAGTVYSWLERDDFYTQAKSSDTLLVIATGETRRYANILLTVGVVRMD